MEVIQIDSREKDRAIKKILADFDAWGVPYIVSKLYVGDYALVTNGANVIDRKQSLLELASNLGKDLPRFRRELENAKQAGIHITILCEHGAGVTTLDDVLGWENPRLKESPLALSGEALYRKMRALTAGYGVEWVFCRKDETAKWILEILGVSR